MRKIFLPLLVLIGLGIAFLSRPNPEPPQAISLDSPPLPKPAIQYNSYTLEQSVVHTLLIPGSHRFLVTPALSQDSDTLERVVKKNKAIAAINGGFFDPKNRKTTSYVVRQGVLVADPRLNEGLMDNPANAPYMDKILDRTEFRRYRCGQTIRYDITFHNEPPPSGCQLVDALGAGPRLLPDLTMIEEGFLHVSNGKPTRDLLGSNRPNARSAVGITPDGSILWVMVAQKPDAPTTSGMSLPTLAAFMKSKGVEKAMNLDGGSSSSFYYNGKTFYGKVDKQGNLVKRNVVSVLLLQETNLNPD